MPENIKKPYIYMNTKMNQINAALGKIAELTSNNVSSLTKMNTDETLVEITMQSKQGGEWVNDHRTIVTAEADYKTVEQFFLHLSGVEDISLTFFEYLTERDETLRFPVGFYMREQEWKDSSWENLYQVRTIANEQQLLSEMTYDFWEEGKWSEEITMQYMYDAKNRIIETLYRMDYEETGTIQDVLNQSFTYDDNDNMTMTVLAVMQDGQWQDGYKVTFEYDGNGNPIKDESFILIGAFGWQAHTKITRTFTAANQLNTQKLQIGIFGILWDNQLEEFNYDGQGNLSEHFIQFWQANDWQNVIRLSYQYNGQNLMTEKKTENYNQTWENSEKYSYEYDGRGNNTNELFEIWDNNQWRKDNQIQYEYTHDDKASYVLYQVWEDQWVDSVQFTFNYDYTAIAKSDYQAIPDNFQLTNYPNPYNPYTTIQFDLPQSEKISIIIYDLMGRTVCNLIREKSYLAGTHKIIWNGEKSQGEKLSSGIYFIHIVSEKYQFSKRCLLINKLEIKSKERNRFSVIQSGF